MLIVLDAPYRSGAGDQLVIPYQQQDHAISSHSATKSALLPIGVP